MTVSWTWGRVYGRQSTTCNDDDVEMMMRVAL